MRAIHLVPTKPQKALRLEDAQSLANNAYTKARAAQRRLVSRLSLSELLHRPPPVTYGRLRGEITEASKQVENAQAVLDALTEARDALEATK